MSGLVFVPTLTATFKWHYAANRPLARGVRLVYRVEAISDEPWKDDAVTLFCDSSRWAWNQAIVAERRQFEKERLRLRALPWTYIAADTKHQIQASKQGIASAHECLEWGRYLGIGAQLLFDVFLKEREDKE